MIESGKMKDWNASIQLLKGQEISEVNLWKKYKHIIILINVVKCIYSFLIGPILGP